MNTKKTLLLLLCGILVFCFAACNQTQPDMTEAPTNTTNTTTNPVEETTQATEPEETTEVTEPEETEPEETTAPIINSLSEYPAEGRKLSEEEMKLFQDLLENPNEETPVWYNMATTCLYSNPRELDFYNLLQAIPGETREFTADEMKFLNIETKNTAQSGLIVINELTADEILQQYFGIALDDCYKRGVELGAVSYWKDTGYYYLWGADKSGRGFPTVEAVYQRDGGFYDIYYTSESTVSDLFRTKIGRLMEEDDQANVLGFCLTLKETDTDYQVVSNVRLMKTEEAEPDLMALVKPQGKPLSEEEMIPFHTLLEVSVGDRVYNLATAFLIERPEKVNLNILLRAVPELQRKLTTDEEEFLKNTNLCGFMPSYVKKHGGPYIEINIYKASDIDRVLQQYFGISLDDYDKYRFGAVYWDDTDCYYTTSGSVLTGMPIIQAIYCRGGVYYDIYYISDPYNGYLYYTGEMDSLLTPEEQEKVLCFCLTLKDTDSGYQIVSNTRVYRPEEPKEEVWTPQ